YHVESALALEHGEFPVLMRVVDAQDVEAAIVAPHLDVAIVGPEPLIEGFHHAHARAAEAKARRHRRAVAAGAGLDLNAHRAGQAWDAPVRRAMAAPHFACQSWPVGSSTLPSFSKNLLGIWKIARKRPPLGAQAEWRLPAGRQTNSPGPISSPASGPSLSTSEPSGT